MKIAEAFVEIRPDTSQFEGEVKRKAQSLGATFAGIFGAVAFGAGLKKSIDAASNLNETVSKSRQLFGAAGRDMEAMADKAAKTMGLSKRSYLDAAAGIKGLLDNLGLADEQSVAWSKNLVALGADLASFYNTSTEDAALAISSALRGEQEPIRRYNVNINEAAIKTKAFEMGLYSGKGAIDSAAKAQAVLALITDQTAAAQGDFARTADGVANSQRIAAAETENAAASMGQSLLPVYQRAVQVVGWLAEGFGALPAPVQLAVVALIGMVALAGPLGTLKDAVSGAVKAMASVTATQSIVAFGVLAGVLAVAAIAYFAFTEEENRAAKAARELTARLTDSASKLDVQKVATLSAADAAREFSDAVNESTEQAMRDFIASHPGVVAAMQATGVTMDQMTTAAHDQGEALILLGRIQHLAAQNGIELDLSQASVSAGASELERNLWVMGKQLALAGEAAALSTEQLVELARVGDVAAISALKASGNWYQLTDAERAAAQATLDAATAAGEAVDPVADLATEVRKLSDDYAALIGQLDNRDAYRNMEDGIDAVAAAASALFDASDPRPLEEKQRAYQQALDDSTRDLLAWADTLAAKIPAEQVTKVRTLIDQGSYDYARALLGALEVGMNSTFEVVPKRSTRGPMQSYDVGGYIDRDQVAMVHRNEVVLPLSNPARIAALLGDPRVAPAMAAAGGGGGFVAPGSSSSGFAGGGDVYHLHGWSETQVAELERHLDARKAGRR